MVDLTGHEAGNGGYSQRKPTDHRVSSTRKLVLWPVFNTYPSVFRQSEVIHAMKCTVAAPTFFLLWLFMGPARASRRR